MSENSMISEIATWGDITDIKVTGLYPNQGKICPLCGKDSGQGPVRMDFLNSVESKYFHRDCAAKLENAVHSFF